MGAPHQSQVTPRMRTRAIRPCLWPLDSSRSWGKIPRGWQSIVSSLLSWRLLHLVLPSECERATQGSQGVTTVSLFNSLCPARAAGWLVTWLPFNTDHPLQVNQMLPVKRTVQPRKLYWTFLTGEPQKCQNYWKKKKKLDRRWWYRKFSWEVGGLFSVEMQQWVLKWLLSSNIHLEAPATSRHLKSAHLEA